VRVLADDGRAWAIGAAASGGAFVAFVVSRTIGLPSFHPTDWELSGIIALLLEAIVVSAAVRRRAGEGRRASSFA
jgi:drug/metabolite transporter superfamily protein YnfA